MEDAAVVGVTTDKKIAKVTLLNVPDEPGIAAQIFHDVADKDINVRLIIQSAAADHRAGITFIIEDEFADAARKLVAEWKQKGLRERGHGRERRRHDRHRRLAPRLDAGPVGPDVHGAGERDINVDCISTSEMTVSCVIALEDIERGVKAVHDEFFANAPARESPAGTWPSRYEALFRHAPRMAAAEWKAAAR